MAPASRSRRANKGATAARPNIFAIVALVMTSLAPAAAATEDCTGRPPLP
jgi:hypothetical protein